MKKKMIFGRLAAALMSSLLVLTLCCSAYASERVDTGRTGSISLTLVDTRTHEPVPDGKARIYQVAEIDEDADGNQVYSLTNGFEDSKIELGDLSDITLGSQFKKAISDSSDYEEQDIDETGFVAFMNLPVGVYLVMQSEAPEGYSSFTSFLVSVPLMEDGAYTYNVDASPKMSILPDGYTHVSPTPTPSTDEDEEEEDEDEEEDEEDDEVTPTPTAAPRENALPQTGQLDWPIPVLAAAGILLFLFGWYMRKGKNENDAQDK